MSPSELNEYLENIIDDIGGLGLFQWILITIVLGSKISVAWSTLMMTYGGAIPDWYCNWTTPDGAEFHTNKTFWKTCDMDNYTVEPLVCESKVYDPDMSTVVNEWELVCDRDWITSTITTIQMGGLFFGGFVSGQIADMFGRKFTYFAAIFILLVFNGTAAFSTSWEMFAVLRFFIGVGCGFYLTVYFTFLIEFTPRKYRSMLISLPFWPVFNIIFALLCWWLHDWKYVQLAIAASNLPFFLAICFVPESYRWLVANGNIKKAHDVIAKIAKTNGKQPPDYEKFFEMAVSGKLESKEKTYTIVDLFKHRRFLRYTVCVSFGWICCGYGYYAISFGVQQLSGNLYINLILINAMDIVAIVVWYFSNCIGRKWTALMFFCIGGSIGIGVGIIQIIDFKDKDTYINVFALGSKLCVSSGWSALMILTSELYPTVIRNIGYGINNALARVGAMIAPQLVYASEDVPGLSYLMFGGLMLLSAILVATLPETNRTALKDTIEFLPDKNSEEKKEDKSVANPGYDKDEYTAI